jgi:hypothetical protein
MKRFGRSSHPSPDVPVSRDSCLRACETLSTNDPVLRADPSPFALRAKLRLDLFFLIDLNRLSIVSLAARRKGIARSAVLHLDCARSASGEVFIGSR